VLATYAAALVPLAVMLAGAVVAVEMSYRLSTQPELGPRLRVLGVAVDASSAWPWLAAALALVGGFLAFRATWPGVTSAWARASGEAEAARP